MADRPDAVTVSFTLTRSELYRTFTSQLVRRMWFMLLLPIAGAVTVVLAIVNPADPSVNLNSGLIAFFVGAFLFCGVPYLQARWVMKAPNFAGEMTLTVSDDGIEFTG